LIDLRGRRVPIKKIISWIDLRSREERGPRNAKY